MARIVVSTYMVRYPLGGNLWWALQWPAGFRALGMTFLIVEKAHYQNSCFDPSRQVMSDDCAYGLTAVRSLLERHGLSRHFCYVDAEGKYHGLTRSSVEEFFVTADALVDIGNHGTWLPEAANTALRVFVDVDPGYTQIRMQNSIDAGASRPNYNRFYTIGANIGTPASDAPTAGIEWRHVFNPVMTNGPPNHAPPAGAPFTTVMNWHAHDVVTFRGRSYGQKDVEFEKFISLPRRVKAPMEIAVAGKNVPSSRLVEQGWRLADAHRVTRSVDSYVEYVAASAGEFSVCKHVFAATRSGWFSDRSAAYLAGARPVVVEDTEIRAHLPCGEGLFAVSSVEEAADAIERIRLDYARHSEAARQIACEYLDTSKVLKGFVDGLGL